jgi:hypothetical protein
VENWKAIPGWDGLYEVSDAGQVRSIDRVVKGRSGPTRYKGRILKPGQTTSYAMVTLVETGVGRRQCAYVHDLVLLAFVGPKPSEMEVCHGPKGALDNSLANLRYDTRSANALDRHSFGKGWPKLGRKPLLARCAVCDTDIQVFRRKERPYHLCGSATCLSEWGRTSMLRKTFERAVAA